MKQNRNHAQRNLYVLNLPLDATTDQFESLFAEHGHVAHAVILATLDNVARRRGFILMSSPAEAKNAIERLDGFSWHGYRIEVSYAIVQRSGTPFTPASPIGAVQDTTDTPPIPQMQRRVRDAQGALPQVAEVSSSLAGSQSNAAAATLFIQNLDTNVLSSESYLRALVAPFGHIRDLEATCGIFAGGGASASVQYCCHHSAVVAKHALDGLVIGNGVLSAHLAREIRPTEGKKVYSRQALGTGLSFDSPHSRPTDRERYASDFLSGIDFGTAPPANTVGTGPGTWTTPLAPLADGTTTAAGHPRDWSYLSGEQASLPLPGASGDRHQVDLGASEWRPPAHDNASFDLWTSKGINTDIWPAAPSERGAGNDPRQGESAFDTGQQPSGQSNSKDTAFSALGPASNR